VFDFHQTKLQNFYTNLSACFGEMEVFLHKYYIIWFYVYNNGNRIFFCMASHIYIICIYLYQNKYTKCSQNQKYGLMATWQTHIIIKN
jgi:hypothetical protein